MMVCSRHQVQGVAHRPLHMLSNFNKTCNELLTHDDAWICRITEQWYTPWGTVDASKFHIGSDQVPVSP